MLISASTLRFLRQTHLYIGLFISPALLFFALTGAIQTFDLHETRPGNDYKPPAWVLPLAQLHKKQTIVVPAPRKEAPKPDQAPAASPSTSAPAAPRPSFPAEQHLPLKIFFLLVALGLFTSTLTGILMAWKYNRSRIVTISLLLAGIAIPLLLLRF
jgi:hypothetical protein